MTMPDASDETVVVPNIEDMDDETFRKHHNARHRGDTTLRSEISNAMAWHRLAPMWRAFHQRCHALAVSGHYDHEHLEEWE